MKAERWRQPGSVVGQKHAMLLPCLILPYSSGWPASSVSSMLMYMVHASCVIIDDVVLGELVRRRARLAAVAVVLGAPVLPHCRQPAVEEADETERAGQGLDLVLACRALGRGEGGLRQLRRT